MAFRRSRVRSPSSPPEQTGLYLYRPVLFFHFLPGIGWRNRKFLSLFPMFSLHSKLYFVQNVTLLNLTVFPGNHLCVYCIFYFSLFLTILYKLYNFSKTCCILFEIDKYFFIFYNRSQQIAKIIYEVRDYE